MLWDADVVLSGGRQQRSIRHSEDRSHPTWSQTPRTHRSISRGSREIPGSAHALAWVRAVNPKGARRR
jgi:hypothetical protein